MDLNLINILTEIGLNNNEARVYLATLELGESTVLPISKKSGIKRTYCYDILTSLTQKGLISFIEKNHRRRYMAEDPKKIEQMLKLKLDNLSESLPELRSIFNKSTSKPKVRFYEGIEGLITVYDQLSNINSLDAIGSPQYIEKYLKSHYKGQQTIPANAKIRDLITSDGQLGWYHHHYIKPHQQYHFLPKWARLTTDLLIFDNKLALISYKDTPHVITIEDSSIVETHKVMFELLWTMLTAARGAV